MQILSLVSSHSPQIFVQSLNSLEFISSISIKSSKIIMHSCTIEASECDHFIAQNRCMLLAPQSQRELHGACISRNSLSHTSLGDTNVQCDRLISTNNLSDLLQQGGYFVLSESQQVSGFIKQLMLFPAVLRSY